MGTEQKTIIGPALFSVMLFAAAALILPAAVDAGSLDPSAPPGPTMKTLDEVPPTWSRKLSASERFELVLGGAAVLDHETGLVWEQSPGTGSDIWSEAVNLCYQKNLGGRGGWHLPTLEQLASLADTSEINPSLPAGHPFSNVQSGLYWSATTIAGNGTTNFAWSVSFTNGNVDFTSGNKLWNKYMWCVRGGQSHDTY